MTQPLVRPYRMGSLDLPNRVVMAPMTRNRANNSDLAATELHAEYYSQRASAGLIISEGTYVSPRAIGFIQVPGLYTDTQVAGWRKVTDAVRAAGGRMFAQLWHVGAMSHPDLQENGALPVAPSAINPNDKAFTTKGHTPTVTPRAMTIEEVAETVQEFRLASRNAMAAGFDGVELHGANGYLFSQFFARSMNQRTDRYGGSIENRARFLFEVLDAIAQEMPLDRVGVRINPALNMLGGVHFDTETYPLFNYVVTKLNHYNLAYLHLMEPINPVDDLPLPTKTVAEHFRPLYKGTIITATDYTRESGNKVIEAGNADLVAFGRAFISNPDLVERFTQNAPLTVPDRATFYGGGPEGYIDYRRLDYCGNVETVDNDQRVGLDYATARARIRSK